VTNSATSQPMKLVLRTMMALCLFGSLPAMADPEVIQKLALEKGQEIQLERDVQKVKPDDEDYLLGRKAAQIFAETRKNAAPTPVTELERRIHRLLITDGKGAPELLLEERDLMFKNMAYARGSEFAVLAAWRDASRVLVVCQQSPQNYAVVYEKQPDGSWKEEDRQPLPFRLQSEFAITGGDAKIINERPLNGTLKPLLKLLGTTLVAP